MYHVNVNSKGGYLFDVDAKGYHFNVDLGGKGVTPPDALLAALGSCVGVYLRKYAEGTKLDITEFNVDVSAEFSKEPPIGFRKIAVSVDLKGVKLDDRRLKAITEFIKNCPVHNTLKLDPDVELTIV